MARPSSVRQARTKVLKAMAHPSRLLILETLAERGERCVCELQRLVGSDMSTVSKHLALMRRAGLLDDRRQGLQVFYRLRVPCVMRFFECVDAVRDEKPPVQLAVVRRRS
jgi:ArsR family transcriptional regulator